MEAARERLARLSDERVKASRDDDRQIQDLAMLLARKVGVSTIIKWQEKQPYPVAKFT